MQTLVPPLWVAPPKKPALLTSSNKSLPVDERQEAGMQTLVPASGLPLPKNPKTHTSHLVQQVVAC
jgi:hypothetical protein